MTIAQDTHDFAADGADPLPDHVRLPLVSVIVVNHNYGRFLADAVASVYAQTYPRVECVVVDDASSDESPAVIDALALRHPDLVIVRRQANGGQTQASLDGLAASRGPYVIFLDADDVLLPRCAEVHMAAHLSLRRHVGFTSGDMLQVVDGEVVVSTGSTFNNFVLHGRPMKPAQLRRYRHAFPHPAMPEPALPAAELYYVPLRNKHWVWSPTSGNCFRRDALSLFADNPGLAGLRTGTDMYFAHAIGALCGSVLIDEPVFAYRLHGGNLFTQRAQLDGVLAYTPGSAGDSNDKARLLIIDQLVDKVERFTLTSAQKARWKKLLSQLDVPDRDPGKPRWARRSRAAAVLTSKSDAVAAQLGPMTTAALMMSRGAPLRHVLDVLRR